MEVRKSTTEELVITRKELERVCNYLRESLPQPVNSFLGIHREPTIEEFIRALDFYLFTSQGD